MLLKNDVNKFWMGFLVDGLGGQEEAFKRALVNALEARNIPKCTIKPSTVNMWWRKKSHCIDVWSSLDGSAGSAFIQTIDRCIRDTILTIADESAIHAVSYISKKG
jgi:hypothetical protein